LILEKFPPHSPDRSPERKYFSGGINKPAEIIFNAINVPQTERPYPEEYISPARKAIDLMKAKQYTADHISRYITGPDFLGSRILSHVITVGELEPGISNPDSK